MLATVVLSVFTAVGVYLPSPQDQDGWGLRVHNLSPHGPYLLGEDIGPMRFRVTLINFSAETREHDPLTVARDAQLLDLSITQPDGNGFRRMRCFTPTRDAATRPVRLRPGEFSSLEGSFVVLGYRACKFVQVGRHCLHASIEIGVKRIKGPPIEFEVLVAPAKAVLVSHAVALEGTAKTESSRPVVQQLVVDGRTLLVYYSPYTTVRLAELPGECDMTVEGAYGNGGPLEITYRVSPGTSPTRLLVRSLSGKPWTDEDERHYRERVGPYVAPAPRAKP